jgi:DNA-binding NarL/FixJ family response regulator
MTLSAVARGEHMEKSRIVIAEDHVILREGLKSLISSHPNLEVVGEAGTGLDAIRIASAQKPDLMILDLSMPEMSGLTAMPTINKISPKTKIIVLTVHQTDEYIFSAFQAGAKGYVLKDSPYEELLMAITHVLGGKTYISAGISERVIRRYVRKGSEPELKTPLDILTTREKEILQLVAEGYRGVEISRMLAISTKTVDKHRANIMRKLNIHNVSGLTTFAIQTGLVDQNRSQRPCSR